ncbi:hypothetical protein [Aquaspirillum sp. LM1]|uniref:hypothetical protein n=1 Tax=Aquaspirillum sp. LM1 TaxID=1938604 RepID=UPI0015C56C43|nr:hypothetical protein [Aquaspirillum sp. LM1]
MADGRAGRGLRQLEGGNIVIGTAAVYNDIAADAVGYAGPINGVIALGEHQRICGAGQGKFLSCTLSLFGRAQRAGIQRQRRYRAGGAGRHAAATQGHASIADFYRYRAIAEHQQGAIAVVLNGQGGKQGAALVNPQLISRLLKTVTARCARQFNALDILVGHHPGGTSIGNQLFTAFRTVYGGQAGQDKAVVAT